MPKYIKLKVIIAITLLTLPILAFAAPSNTSINSSNITPTVNQQIFKQAQTNNNWKIALETGKHGQVVLMSISPLTNPNNEIGMETHKFDQIIIIANGDGKAVLNGKTWAVTTGDMIFIPQGTQHNIINLNRDKDLKIISIYSNTDIPAHSVFKKKTDEPKD